MKTGFSETKGNLRLDVEFGGRKGAGSWRYGTDKMFRFKIEQEPTGWCVTRLLDSLNMPLEVKAMLASHGVVNKLTN